MVFVQVLSAIIKNACYLYTAIVCFINNLVSAFKVLFKQAILNIPKASLKTILFPSFGEPVPAFREELKGRPNKKMSF